MKTVNVRHLGLARYEPVYAAMQAFNDSRRPDTVDEVWSLEHLPVYTLGLAGRSEHVLDAGDIPVVYTDRGGQVTYHGPGQLVVYLLLDLKRSAVGVKYYVHQLEQAVMDMLAGLSIGAARRARAPGVYVDDRKVAALGVRVRGGCCYHGLALNVDMDMTPFQGINPCGYQNLEVTQIRDYGVELTTREAADLLLPELMKRLGFDRQQLLSGLPRQPVAADRIVA
jgi:lipoyl(octanoyl) transferase